MRTITTIIKQKQAERRAIRHQLENLTDPHFLRIADFARNFELNTSRPATAAECQEVRTLLCQR